MNANYKTLSTGLLLGMFSSVCTAYEIDTHTLMTESAFLKSNLATPDGLRHLGLLKSRRPDIPNNLLTLNLGRTFHDIRGINPVREAKSYDHLRFMSNDLRAQKRWTWVSGPGDPLDPNSDVSVLAGPYSIRDWLARGAVREDDASSLTVALSSLNGPTDVNDYQQLDSGDNLNRFCNHFYDPINNRRMVVSYFTDPLAAFGCNPHLFGSAPMWALGVTGVDGGGAVDAGRRNRFTWQDAREAEWRALTGLNDSLLVADPPADTRKQRDAYWATTFRALGGVVHNLQDMGQPQHTRNESHPTGYKGITERYLNARALGLRYQYIERDPGSARIVEPLDYGTLPPQVFARARDYFNTHTGGASQTLGQGIANLSNREFFTAGANFGNTAYSMPVSNRGEYCEELHPNPYTPTVKESYLMRTFPTGQSCATATVKIKMTRESLFSEELFAQDPNNPGAKNTIADYAIDEAVISDQVRVLIPRAVSYSAGLINFFFRGQLEVTTAGKEAVFGLADHATESGFSKIRVKIKNVTPAVPDLNPNVLIPQDMVGGKFVAVARYHKDKVFKEDLSEAIGLGACDSLAAVYGTNNAPILSDGSPNPDHVPTVDTNCREGEERQVVSGPINITTLASGDEKEIVFDFTAKPIPFGAVDMALQIVYRGKLGEEEDAIVTNIVELADPMFVVRHNVADFIWASGNKTAFNKEPYVPPSLPYAFVSTDAWWGPGGAPSDAPDPSRPCFSVWGAEKFPCFTSSHTMKYRYTFGDRTASSVATATDVPSGRFTRMVVLEPLWKDRPTTTERPLLRAERIRVAGRPYTGESIELPQRHGTKTLKWPHKKMRGVNAWHSDGYAWWTHRFIELTLLCSLYTEAPFPVPETGQIVTSRLPEWGNTRFVDASPFGDQDLSRSVDTNGDVSYYGTDFPCATGTLATPGWPNGSLPSPDPSGSLYYEQIPYEDEWPDRQLYTPAFERNAPGRAVLPYNLTSSYSLVQTYLTTSYDTSIQTYSNGWPVTVKFAPMEFPNGEFGWRRSVTPSIMDKLGASASLNNHSITNLPIINQKPYPIVIDARFK
jgi:hypothetical protein